MGAGKTELQRIYRLDELINTKVALARMYRDKAEKCVSSISGMPRGGGTGDKVGDYATLAAEAQTEAAEMEREYLSSIGRIKGTIDAIVDWRYQTLLSRHYLLHENWREVADAMHYSERHVLRLHGEALKEYEKLM